MVARLLAIIACCALPAAPSAAGIISLIIDDLGYSYTRAKHAMALHPNVTLAVLPDAPHAERISSAASYQGRELMLHLPMQSLRQSRLDEPSTLTLDMSRSEVETTVQRFLDRFPSVIGVNNHMGSLLTQHPGHMQWLMETLAINQPLYFVDSKTGKGSIAKQVALENGIPTAERTIFLDPGEAAGSETIWQQIKQLERIADTDGFALGIGHPHKITLKTLRQAIPWLEARGHKIVPVSEYISKMEETPCPECLSPLLRVVKSSKQLP